MTKSAYFDTFRVILNIKEFETSLDRKLNKNLHKLKLASLFSALQLILYLITLQLTQNLKHLGELSFRVSSIH